MAEGPMMTLALLPLLAFIALLDAQELVPRRSLRRVVGDGTARWRRVRGR